MIDPIQIFWSPAGASPPTLGSRALLDISDGDTPNLRMPVRMLSVDTPEVTAKTDERAAVIDVELKQLAQWIREGRAPIEPALAEFLLPKLETGRAGTLQLEQGRAASAFAKQNIETRLTRPDATRRKVFIRIADAPFDTNHRLLAYVAPTYNATELRDLTRAERATFNLDLVTHGWAAPFVIYPAIPGAADLPLLVKAAVAARAAGDGIWGNPATLLAYEYRAMEKLHRVTRKIVGNERLEPGERHSWRERYCADMRIRVLHGPEHWFRVDPEYRLWFWPADLNEAVGRLNLTPSPQLAGAA